MDKGMEIRSDIDRSVVRSAHSEFEVAESKYENALSSSFRKETQDGLGGVSYSSSFVACQRCIERSMKSVFKIMKVQYPTKHQTSLNSKFVSDLLNAISGQLQNIDFEQRTRPLLNQDEIVYLHTSGVGRLLMLNAMFSTTYPVCSYGFDRGNVNISSNDLILSEDCEWAVEYARSALKTADAAIDSVATGILPAGGEPGTRDSLSYRSAIHDSYGMDMPGHVPKDPIANYRRNL